MKRRLLFSIALILGLLINPLLAQDYQARMTKFEQVSELEFHFDIQIRNNRADPATTGAWAYNSSQFHININTAMMNGGFFDNVYLTVDNSVSNLPFNQRLIDDNFFYAGPNTALATNSPSTAGGSELMLMNHGDWRTISRFVVKLRNAAGTGFLNFGDVDPQFSFRFSDVIVFQVDYYMDGLIARRGTGSGVPGNTATLLKTPADLIIDTPARQLAGYWFYETNTWDVVTNWNQVLKAATPSYTQVIPGANSNAIINGNCTIKPSLFYTLLPDGNGNGGELTVLTGEEPLYTLTVTSTNADFNVSVRENHGGGLDPGDWFLTNGASGRSVDLPVGQEMRLYTNDPQGYRTFIRWDDVDGTIGTGQNFQDYTMPSKNITVTAVWNPSGKNSNNHPNQMSFAIEDIEDCPSYKNGTRDALYASLTIAHGGRLTVDKLFNDNVNGAPAILVQSNVNGVGSLIHNYDNVPATIERYMYALGNVPVYHQVSVPLTETPTPLSNLFLWSYLFEFNVGSQVWDALGTPTNTELNVHQGYMIIKDIEQGTSEPDPTYVFAGSMNNGDFPCKVEYSAVLNSHNLVPNPYPSAIDWDADNGWTKTNVNNSIWIWNPASIATDQYACYVGEVGATPGVGTNGGSRYVPVGQSFFVSTSALAPALSMNNDVRVHSDQAFLKSDQQVSELLRILSSGNNYSDEIVIRFADGATSAFDGQYDATKFYGSADAPQLFSMSSDNKELSINSLEVGEGKRYVDLGFKLEASGLCSFNFSGMESFNTDMQIQLKDRVTGQTIDVRINPEYTFAHSSENDPMRFELIFNGVTSIDEPKTVNQDFFYVDGSLYLNFPQDSQGPFNVTVYNINGQTEFMGVAHDARAVVDLAGLTRGFHIVRVVTSDYSGEKKVVVK